MSLELELDPYCAAEWAEEIGDLTYPRTGDVTALSAGELASLCEQAFKELDSETPAPGALERYQELVDEAEDRELVRR